MPHKDPFDRLLAAQSVLEGVALISNDVLLDASPISRLGERYVAELANLEPVAWKLLRGVDLGSRTSGD